jgi:hypothetical protein
MSAQHTPAPRVVSTHFYDGLSLSPRVILEHARAQVPSPVYVWSPSGTHTRVHNLGNHYAWLAVALHLSMPKEAPCESR